MTKAPMKVKLPKRLIKALGLRPGDYIKLVVDKDGNGIVVEGMGKVPYVDYTDEELKELWEALEEVKGMWADRDDIPDSRTYVRQLREGWAKRWERIQRRGEE
ncbi:MAG: AbrB/MazE/SpoVT family DNA-binding domain-containing protein [Armatimonadetes bacterium]|nr:AbrB/MazE/SpoVT family DNA-binding domain-containing protein [Armatimonadota bacterium]MDW8028386.1 AbrB/MazE/SpoVT family DNA-binding domain-containing protein [Armatimonadota bacterium]